MLELRHSYTLELLDDQGRPTRAVPLGEDAFMPCYEDLLFTAIRSEQIANSTEFPPARVEPSFLADETPYLNGFAMHLPPVTKHYGLEVFADLAYVQSALRPDEAACEPAPVDRALWRLSAVTGRAMRDRRPRVTLRREPYPLRREPLESRGLPHMAGSHQPFGLFVSKTVMAALRDATVRSLHLERADILTGDVIHDRNGSVAVVVTGRVPAVVEARGTAASFHFSPLTFSAARQEWLAGPSTDAIVGWAHNHPVCSECPTLEPYCPSETVFFSPADRQVHRTSFTAPYEVGLVLGKGGRSSPLHPLVRAYAWQGGVIQEHPIHVF